MSTRLCETPMLISLSAIALVYMVCTISIIWITLRFHKWTRSLTTDNTRIFNMTLCYSLLVTIICLMGLSGISFCVNRDVYIIFRSIGRILSLAQYVFLFYLLFYRIYYVFHGTLFQLSRRTILVFNVLYILYIVIGLLRVILGIKSDFNNRLTKQIVLTILTIIFLILQVSYIAGIIGVFVYKLISVFVHNSDNSDDKPNKLDEDLVSTVTKTFILTLASILSAIIAAVFIIILNYYPSPFVVFLYGFIFALDLITNVVSIICGFPVFHQQYSMICGLCHARCTRCIQCCANVYLKRAATEVQLASNSAYVLDTNPSQKPQS
eukprot:36779_1